MNKNRILNRGTIHKLRDRIKVWQQPKITSKEHDRCHVDQSIVVFSSSSNNSSQVVLALLFHTFRSFGHLGRKGWVGWNILKSHITNLCVVLQTG